MRPVESCSSMPSITGGLNGAPAGRFLDVSGGVGVLFPPPQARFREFLLKPSLFVMRRSMDVSDRPIQAKLKGMRTGCGCFESKDIGDYDTCPHGCVYCYAVRRRSVALKRYQSHDPQGEYLFPVKPLPSDAELPEHAQNTQLPLRLI